MQRVARDVEELSEAVLMRLETLRDNLEGYRRGIKGRVNSIASDLRVLVAKGGMNNAILFKIAALHEIELIVKRDVPPVEGLASILTLSECLSEVKFASGVPDDISLTGYQVITKYANQQGSHEDEFINEDLYRMRGAGLMIGGLPATDAVLIDLAETVLSAAAPLEDKLRNG